jgi:hypothetical protein
VAVAVVDHFGDEAKEDRRRHKFLISFFRRSCRHGQLRRRPRRATSEPISKEARFNRCLASIFILTLFAAERKEREAAVSSLRTYLSRDAEFSRLDFLKLWKGLYYCMWMCDRMRVQQQLADTLAELVDVLQPQNTITFFDAFWSTLAKQWHTLDQHR